MKQIITKKSTFHSKTSCEQHELLVSTEFRVQRLERLIESLLVWKIGSDPYNKLLKNINSILKRRINHERI